ncbi:UNVERIFIED_CONTAM: hypothetical protein RMT77_012331 [Armadillidium vulgare]
MDFYYSEISAPSRAVMLLAKNLGVNLNKKHFDLFKKEQMNPEFLAINPQHCVPTLVDGDFVLWESRAICTYIASRYGKDDSLYPNDPRTRAQIDRLLYFDMGTLFKRFGDYIQPIVFKGEEPDTEKSRLVHEALEWLDRFIEGHDFVVGNKLTVADYALIASVSTFIEAGIDLSGHPNVKNWADRCKNQMKGYDTENEKGLKIFAALLKNKKSS